MNDLNGGGVVKKIYVDLLKYICVYLIMERDLEYEKNNIGYDRRYIEEEDSYTGIKCKNYELCETVLPKWWFDCTDTYLCTGCHIMFGTWGTQTGKGILEISDNLECLLCLENTRVTTYLNCDHKICISCFKRCYYRNEKDDIENEPIFPYPDIEDEYYDDPEDPKWDTDYHLIQKYNDEWNKWEDARDYRYANEAYLRKCSVCSK